MHKYVFAKIWRFHLVASMILMVGACVQTKTVWTQQPWAKMELGESHKNCSSLAHEKSPATLDTKKLGKYLAQTMQQEIIYNNCMSKYGWTQEQVPHAQAEVPTGARVLCQYGTVRRYETPKACIEGGGAYSDIPRATIRKLEPIEDTLGSY